MSKTSLITAFIPVLLFLTLIPVLIGSGISDLSKGAIIGVFLGLALITLMKGKRKAR